MFLKIQIVNLVATCETGETIDIGRLASELDATYNPARYRCAYFKDRHMKAKVSIFGSGKMIAIGSKTEEDARRSLSHLARLLRKRGFLRTEKMTFAVQNVVVTVELGREVNLELLSAQIPGVVYEPEQFAGAIVRPQTSEAAVLVFSSGKMVVAGLKSAERINEAIRGIVDELGLTPL